MVAPYNFDDHQARFSGNSAPGGDLIDDQNAKDLPHTNAPGGQTGHVDIWARGWTAANTTYFDRAFSSGDQYDIGGQTSCTICGWLKVGETDGQPNYFTIHGATAAAQALMCVPRETNSGGSAGPYVGMWDGLSSFNGVEVKANSALTIAIDTWQFYAAGYDATRNKVFCYWGRAAGERHYNEATGVAAGFGYDGTGSSTSVGRWTGGGTPARLTVDHMIWWKGRALALWELDVMWNNHDGLPFVNFAGGTERSSLHHRHAAAQKLIVPSSPHILTRRGRNNAAKA